MIVTRSIFVILYALCVCQYRLCSNINSSSTVKSEIHLSTNQSRTTAPSMMSSGNLGISPSYSSLKSETTNGNYNTTMSPFTESTKTNMNSSSTVKSEIFLSTNRSTITAPSMISSGNLGISPSYSSLKSETTNGNFNNTMSPFAESTKTTNSVVTGLPKAGPYLSKVQLICSFPDVFKPTYKDNKSPELKSYLQSMFTKFEQGLAPYSLRLAFILVNAVRQGSVVVDMTLVMRSNLKINDALLIQNVRNAAISGFGGAITIYRTSIILSSTYVSNQSKYWIIGIVVAIILSIILLIIAVFLYYRYFPTSCACCRKTPRNASSSNHVHETSDNIFEMEYEGHSDRDVIYNRHQNQNVV